MTDQGSRIPLRIETLAEALEKPLDNEAAVLEALLIAQAKGQSHPDLWEALHLAAQRDDRLMELGSAYEKIANDRRLKIMSAQHQAQVFAHVATFFQDFLDDGEAAAGAWERVAQLVPTFPGALEKADELLAARGRHERLVTLYLGLAGQRVDRALQLDFLRKALEHSVREAAGADAARKAAESERTIKIAQQILKLEPADEEALAICEERFTAAGRSADVVRLLEQAISASTDAERSVELRLKLVAAYGTKVPETERTVGHLEEILVRRPDEAMARALAERFLSHKILGARAAQALERVAEVAGDRVTQRNMLDLMVSSQRGPKKLEAHKKLSRFLVEDGDAPGAAVHLEAAIGIDPADDEARRLYLEVCESGDRLEDAAKLFARVAQHAKEPAVRARIEVDLGGVLGALDDAEGSRAAFESALASGADDGASLAAARALLPVYRQAGKLGDVKRALDVVARLEPDPDAHADAVFALGRTLEEEGDHDGAIASYRRVLEVAPSREASEALEAIYEKIGRHAELAEMIERRARLSGKGDEGRALLTRAAGLKRQASDDEGAATLLEHVIEQYGPDMETLAPLTELYERRGDHEKAAAALERQAEIASGDDLVRILARVARAREKSGDDAGAFETHARVLGLSRDATESRKFFEQKLRRGDARLRAAELLLPIFREAGDPEKLLTSLFVIAELSTDREVRVTALEEAFAAFPASDAPDERRFVVAERALRELAEEDRARSLPWIPRLVAAAPDPNALVIALRAHLGDGAADDPFSSEIACALGEALSASGNTDEAVAMFRRVLDFQPDHPIALARASEASTPEERVELFGSALERSTNEERRAELYLLIANVHASMNGDLDAAVTVLEKAHAELPDVAAIRARLFDVLESAKRLDALAAHLERRLSSDVLAAERGTLLRRLAQVEYRAGRAAEARNAMRKAFDAQVALDAEELALAETLAEEASDDTLLDQVLAARIAGTSDDELRSALLARRAAVLVSRDDRDGAAVLLLEAARTTLARGRRERTIELLRQAHSARSRAPATRGAILRLAAETGDGAMVGDALAAFLDVARDPSEREAAIVTARDAGVLDPSIVARAIDEEEAASGPRLSLTLLGAEARADDPAALAAHYEKALAVLPPADATEIFGAVSSYRDAHAGDPAHVAMARLYHEERARRAPPDGEVDAAIAFVDFEREEARDPERALEVCRRALEKHPGVVELRRREADLLVALSRHGEAERALADLEASADDEDDRRRILLGRAALLVDHLDRPLDALGAVEALLTRETPDDEALALAARLIASGASSAVIERFSAILDRVPEGRRGPLYQALLDAPWATPAPEQKAKLFLGWAALLPEEDALRVLARGAVACDGVDELWDRAEKLARKIKAPKIVAAAFREVLERGALPPERASELGQRAVDYHEEWFDEPAHVTALLEAILRHDAQATWAFERLKLAYNANEQFDALFDLFDRVIARTESPEDRADIIDDAAQVAKDVAFNPERAMGYLGALLELRPSDTRTEVALERLYEKYQKREELLALYERRAQRDPKERGVALKKLADLALKDPMDFERVAFAARKLAEDPDAETFATELVFEALGRRGTAEPDDDAAFALSVEWADRMANADRPADEARALGISVQNTRPGRPSLLARLARVQEKSLGDAAAAFATRLELLVVQPSDKSLRKALEKAAQTAETKGELADAFCRAADASADADLAVELFERAAKLVKDGLGDSARGVEIDLKMLARSSGDPERSRAAAHELEALLSQMGRHRERLGVLDRLSGLEETPAARAAVLMTAARLARDELAEPALSANYLARHFAEVGDTLEALDMFVAALAAARDHAALAPALERRAKVAASPKDAREDLRHAARLHHGELGDTARAIVILQEALDAHGPDDVVADELVERLVEADRKAEARALLEREAARATEAARRGRLFAQLGELHRDEEDLAAAVAAFSQALALVPASDRAQTGLEGILGRIDPQASRATLVSAVGALERSYATVGDLARSRALVPARLGCAVDDAERVGILLDAADLEDRADEPKDGLAMTRAAFELDPKRAATRLLERARALGDFTRIADAVVARAEHLDAALPVHADLLRAAAEALLGLDRPEDAESLLRRIDAASASDPVALELLARAELALRRDTRPATLARHAAMLLAEGTSRASAWDEAVALYQSAIEESLRAEGRTEEASAFALTTATTLFDAMVTRSAERRAARSANAFATAFEADDSDRAGAETLAEWVIEVLSDLHGRREDRPAVFDVLKRGADLFAATEKRRKLLLRASEQASPAEAIGIQRALFEQDPTDDPIADGLEQLLFAEGREREVAELRDVRVAASADPEHRKHLRLRNAELLETLGDRDRAASLLEENLAEIPGDESSFRGLARLYEARGDKRALARVFEESGKALATSERERAARRYRKAAEIYAAEDLLKEALRAQRESTELSPLPEELDTLAKLLERAGQISEAAQVLERRFAQTAPEAAEVLALARLHEAAGRSERAIEWLENAAASVNDEAIVSELLGLYQKHGHPRRLQKLLVEVAKREEDPSARARRLREAAEISISQLSQVDEGRILLEEALALDPEDLKLRLLLVEVLGKQDRVADAKELLSALVAQYGARKPKERALVHFELAKLLLAGGDRAGAIAELDVASKIDPSHPDILATLGRIALDEGQFLRAQRTLRALLLVIKPGRAGERSHVARSTVFADLSLIADKQGEPDRKSEYMDSAFEAASESPAEAMALADLLADRGQSQLAIKAFEAALAHAEPGDRAALLRKIAAVQETDLGDAAAAGKTILQAVEADPSHGESLDMAVRLLRGAPEPRALVEAFERSAARTELAPGVRVELLSRAARFAEVDLGDVETAVDTLGRARELAREDQDAVGAEVWRRLAARLADLLGKLGRNAERAKVLEELVELSETLAAAPGERIVALRQLAKERLRLGEEEGACDAVEAAVLLESDPDRVEALLREVLAEKPESYRLTLCFEMEMRRLDRVRAQLDALMRLADLEADALPRLREAREAAGRLGDEEAIARVVGKVAEAIPDSPDTVWALCELADLKARAGDPEASARFLERAARASGPDDERALLLRAAAAAAEASDLAKASALYEELRKRDPADREAWEPLVQLHARAGRISELTHVLGETVVLIDDVDERAELRLMLADLYLASEPQRAQAILEEAFEDAPAHPRTGELLSDVHRKRGDAESLARVLERRLDAAKDVGDGERIAAISVELGALLEARGDDVMAVQVYQAVLDWKADSRDALQALVRLAEKLGDDSGSEDLVDRLLLLEDGEEVVSLARKLARRRREAGDGEGAERALLLAYKKRPSSLELRDELARSYATRGAHVELAEMLRIEAEADPNVASKKALLLRAAELLRDKAGDGRRAADLLELAFRADPEDRDLLFSLMESLSTLSEHQRAIDAVDLAIRIDSGEDSSWLYFSRAVLREALNQGEGALEDLELANRISEGRYLAELRAHLESALLKPSTDRAFIRKMRLRLVAVCDELGEPDTARAVLSEMLRENAIDAEVLEMLGELDLRAGRPDTALVSFRHAAMNAKGEAVTRVALRATFAARAAADVTAARDVVEHARATGPGDPQLTDAIKEIYLALGARAELGALLEEQASTTADEKERYDLRLEAARLYIEEASLFDPSVTVDAAYAPDVGRAVTLLEEAQVENPADIEAPLSLATAYTLAGRIEDAKALATDLVGRLKGRRSVSLGRAYHALYRAELRDGNLSDALEALSKVFENEPQNPRVALELGNLALDLDDVDVAQRAFRALTLMKSSQNGGGAKTRGLAYFHLGRIALNQGDRRRAKLMLEKALSEDPASAEARDLLVQLG